MKITCLVMNAYTTVEVTSKAPLNTTLDAVIKGTAVVENGNQLIIVKRRNCGTSNEIWVEDMALETLQGIIKPELIDEDDLYQV